MLSKWSWIVFNLIIYVTTAPTTLLADEATAFFELIELDYEDMCYNIANAQWSFIVSPSNKTLSTWELQQYSYAEFIKTQKNEVIHKVENMKRFESPIQYKYNVIEKPGDALLKDKDWKKLVHLAGVVELQRSINNHVNKSKNYSREDVEYLLSHTETLENKQAAWNNWYSQLIPLVTNYSNNLLFIAEAAKENGAENVEEYWEMLSGYPGGYNQIKNRWNWFSNVHKKIVKFINTNLAEKYNITNDILPAYLLGSLQGYDWADISPDILPYSESIYDIKKNLWKKKYLGKSLYKTASHLGSMLLKQVPQAEFWDKSEFNQQCPSRVLNFCKDGAMRVFTCSKATISNFVTAHEDVGKILFNQMTVENTPVLNIVNRHSVLEESISTLFGILSASPAWLNHTNLMNNNTIDGEGHMIVSLMITALNILPRLAYYYSADLWRLNAIERNITDPADLVSSWWKYRKEYEGIVPTSTDSPSFLDDSHIVKNKPYLPKILGIMLAFQLYEHIMRANEVRYDIDGTTFVDIIKIIQNGAAGDWREVLEEVTDIYDISMDPLYSYFMPLEEEIMFTYVSGAKHEKEIKELEEQVLREINTPITTPAPTTTTTATKASSYKRTSNKIFTPGLNSSTNSDSDQPNPTQVPSGESSLATTLDNEQNNTPKINTSKAVWAVSAVLIAIVVICIIAIFGRRRCRKTPKNRRYV